MSDPGERAAHISLVGFMAAGKSTVGALVAARLGMDFLDLDDEVERSSGVSVPEIFRTQGEEGFRRLESAALAQALAASRPAVISTGGGAPCHDGNLHRMREGGLVVELDVSLEEFAARAGDPTTRPLLGRSVDELRALYTTRQPYYRAAHSSVATTGRTPEEVATLVMDVVARARTWPRALWSRTNFLALGGRTYPVTVASGSLAELGTLARAVLGGRCSRIAVISENNVAPLYGGAVRDALGGAGFETVLATVPAGEHSKSFEEVTRLCRELAAVGLSRRSAIVALGGGVVGDIAGFVASVLFRGIPYIQVPTTLLAMIDSSIGGKTGIDLAGLGKNLAGTIWQPRAVVADPQVLATLPVREERAAMGELLKYGLLDGEPLWQAIEGLASRYAAAAESRGGDRSSIRAEIGEIIQRCVAYKCGVVSRDETDLSGERALLNLGHTVGHAAEVAGGFSTLRHGEAVALGLVAACRVSKHLGFCGAAVEERVVRMLELLGLDAQVAPWLRRGALDHIRADKKRVAEDVDFIVIEKVGACMVKRISIFELSRILRSEFTV